MPDPGLLQDSAPVSSSRLAPPALCLPRPTTPVRAAATAAAASRKKNPIVSPQGKGLALVAEVEHLGLTSIDLTGLQKACGPQTALGTDPGYSSNVGGGSRAQVL
eukprot:NODE_2486_length_1106_cov_15.225166_g2045_i1.p4 GENE.NODE_2486_length_1106_cov_15.225166_g2045_i1~~NODE_2486_length_1106_cov_15.225166_g2045_i1.p4  ORF type:complete len:105 (-),score=2.53 NODE_2486_length_1106_cov_15.225166_g2045_i1:161-475(-)